MIAVLSVCLEDGVSENKKRRTPRLFCAQTVGFTAILPVVNSTHSVSRIAEAKVAYPFRKVNPFPKAVFVYFLQFRNETISSGKCSDSERAETSYWFVLNRKREPWRVPFETIYMEIEVPVLPSIPSMAFSNRVMRAVRPDLD